MANLKFKVGGVWNQIITIKGDKGDAGDALPAGGVAGQLLIKNSATDSDATWQNNPTHDDRYYTETEMNTLLSGKSNTGHGHAIADVTNLQTTLDGKSSTAHLHDDRYYTETEVDAALAGKSDTGHAHDDRYYTEVEINFTFAPKANPTFTGTQTLPNIVTNGIKFPATQVPSADPNTLDDYEEGTWTPVNASNNNQLGTFSTYTGRYIKIGKLVTVTVEIAGIGMGYSSATGYTQLTGLPFSPQEGSGGVWASGNIAEYLCGMTLATSGNLWILAPQNINVTSTYIWASATYLAA